VPSFAFIYAALYGDYFDKEGVDVTLTNAGSSLVPMIVSNQADIGVIGLTAAWPLPRQGKAVSVVVGFAGRIDSATVLGTPAITDIHQCKTFGAQAGSLNFSTAVYLQQVFGVTYNIVTFANVGAITAAQASGQVDCSIIGSGTAEVLPLVNSGKIKVVYDPTTDPNVPAGITLLKQATSAGVWGLKDRVQAKSEAIVRFLRALTKAKALSPADTANLLISKDQKDWPGLTLQDLTAAITQQSSVLTEITSAGWDVTEQLARGGGLPYVDPSQPGYSYADMVDMTYWKKAKGG
jgi:hypothetical protein